MNFCWVTLQVMNLEEALSFYNGVLGLQVISRHSGNGIEMAMLGEENQAKIELLQNTVSEKKVLHSDISIGIAVESLEDTMVYLKSRNIPILRGPIAPNSHTRFIFIKDPQGYEVQLVELS